MKIICLFIKYSFLAATLKGH